MLMAVGLLRLGSLVGQVQGGSRWSIAVQWTALWFCGDWSLVILADAVEWNSLSTYLKIFLSSQLYFIEKREFKK
jgi:hypothetical protein